MTQIVLASTSPARAKFLANASDRISRSSNSGVDEAALKAELIASGARPATIAQALAEAKAVAVSRRRAKGWSLAPTRPWTSTGRLVDKARRASTDARMRLLDAARGHRHRLHSGVALASGGKVMWRDVSHVESDHAAIQRGLPGWLSGPQSLGPLAGVGRRLRIWRAKACSCFERIDGDYFSNPRPAVCWACSATPPAGGHVHDPYNIRDDPACRGPRSRRNGAAP